MSSRQRRQARRARRRIETSPVRVVVVGLTVVAAILAIAWVAVRSPAGLPATSYVRLKVSVPDVGKLQIRNEVRANGVRIGQVSRTEVAGGRAVAELQLDPGTRVPSDTTAAVRAQGLLGQRYLELRMGQSRTALAEEAVIRGDETSLTFGVPETLDTFDAATRRGLGATVGALGAGFDGRAQQLNHALDVAPAAGRRVLRTLRTVRAQSQRRGTVVASLDGAVTVLDDVREQLVTGMHVAADALTPINDRRPALNRALDELPAALDAVRTNLPEGRRLLASARDLSAAAVDTLPTAEPGLRSVNALLHESPRPLARGTALLQEVHNATPPVVRIADEARPLLDPLDQTIADARPQVDIIVPRICDLDNFAENWRSTLGYATPTPNGGAKVPSGRIGPIQAFRITADVGAETLMGGATVAPQSVKRRQNPFPKPCQYSPGTPYPQYAPSMIGRSR